MSHSVANAQLLTFTIADSSYGVDITRIQEIRVAGKIREIPNTAQHFIGVIEFRHLMVPVIDLRTLFGYEKQHLDKQSVLIVVNIISKEGKVLLAMLVDSVLDVLDALEGSIQNAPQLDEGSKPEYFSGLIKQQEDIVVVIDLDLLLLQTDLEQLKNIVSSGQVA